MELLIIGIDALDPRILMNNIDKFPNMQKFIKAGVFSDYFGYADGYGSYDNWISLYTGLTPEEHGIIKNKFIETKEEPKRLDYSDKNPFWEEIKELSFGLWRIPKIDPITIMNGYRIGGEVNYEFVNIESIEDTSENLKILEKNLIKSLKDETPKVKPVKKIKHKSEIMKELEEDYYYIDSYYYLKEELDFFKNNIIIAEKEIPSDVLFYYNSTLDLIQHMQQYDSEKRVVLDSMKEIDKFIGELYKELRPKNIIIISDHGSSSFSEVLGKGNEKIEREAFGMEKEAVWLENGEIVVKARNGGILSAIHDVKATFIACGEMFKEGKYIKDMRTIDFYPTLLEMFNVNVPEGRSGFVLDIFKNKNIMNKDQLYPKNKEKEEVLIIQNIEVFHFNKIINQIFLKNRFSNITVLCEEKYKHIFELNARLSDVIGYRENELNILSLKEKYDRVFIPKKNITEGSWEYIEL